MTDERSPKIPLDLMQIESKRFKDEKDIIAYINDLHAGESTPASLSWSQISELLFDGRIHPATLSAYARGTRPIVNRAHRRIMLIKGDERNRIMINADDPVSAAITILTARKPGGEFRASGEYIRRLVELLESIR